MRNKYTINLTPLLYSVSHRSIIRLSYPSNCSIELSLITLRLRISFITLHLLNCSTSSQSYSLDNINFRVWATLWQQTADCKQCCYFKNEKRKWKIKRNICMKWIYDNPARLTQSQSILNRDNKIQKPVIFRCIFCERK